MPTVLRIDGFRFYFFAGDIGEPAHVHVSKGDKDTEKYGWNLELACKH